jgi:xylulokinase
MMPSVAAVDADGRPIGPGLLYGDGRGRLSPALASSHNASADDTGASGSDPTASASDPTASASDPTASASDPTASDEMAHLAGWAASQAPDACGLWPAQSVANAALAGTGEGVIDLASAFAAGPLFGGSGWDEVVCARAGLRPAQLPTVAMFGQAVGRLGPEALPGEDHGEIVLGAGSVDGLCEQLVAGAVEDGDVLVALGSTLVVWLCVPGWPEEVPGLWRVPHIVGGKAMVGGASNAGGMWVDWADRVLRPSPPDAEDSLQAGDVPLWWPWARGERVPWHDPSLRISLGGADLAEGPAAMRRAVLEATGFVVRHIVELASGTGTRPKRYILSGGGTANPLWRQALADVLGEPVTPMETSYGAAVGAAFLARMAAGLETTTDDAARWVRWSAPVDPRPQWSRAAGERYQRWCQELPARP